MGQRIAIVGAGYGGLAAAVTLAERGVPVSVFESCPAPGGRALANGQYVLTGAHSALLRLMHLVGVPSDSVLRLPLELRYADGFAFRALWLPAPFGLLGGLLLCSKLPLSERFGAIRFMLSLRRTGFREVRNTSVSNLLEQNHQNGLIGHYLWRPLCIAALNTPPEQASAQVFATVLCDSLAGESEASDLLLPRVDLSRLFPEPAAHYVRAHGGEVRVNETVHDLAALRKEFTKIVVAVGPHQLKTLLPGFALEFEYQPVTTCTLQYPETTKLPFPMLGLADGLVQWAFDRGVLTGERGRIACVIGAQGDHQQMQPDELAAACHRELARHLKAMPDPEWSQVIAEKRATVACTPAMKALNMNLPIPGVVLAGDYTDPDYPPTLEAAVRSGIRAADRVLQT